MSNFLIDSYDLSQIIFSKPKKHGDYLVCKVKYPDQDSLLVQFPKMLIVSDCNALSKNIELEFKNETGYNKKVYNILSKLDDHIINYITEHSEEWFNKKIPNEQVFKMYNKFIKAPKTCDSRCTLNFGITPKSSYIDKSNDTLLITDLRVNSTLECIAQMKYVIFSKDTCFVNWELCTSKLYKKIIKIPKFGFIDVPEDKDLEESDDESIAIQTFY
jgi:hypothetical protein